MPRVIKTAEEIQAEVHRRVHALREVSEDGTEIGIPLPTWHQPDDTGCNWEMRYIRNPGSHVAAVERIIAAVRGGWNLKD